jgi:hypothetical protein
VQLRVGAVGDRDAQDGQRAGLAREPDLSAGELMPRLVVPQIRCDPAGQPVPAQVILSAIIISAKAWSARFSGGTPAA